VSTDPHRHTPAGPDPAAGSATAGPVAPDAVPGAASTAEPTPTVGASDASYSTPPGSAAPAGSAAPGGLDLEALSDRPEVLAGAAFAGGLVAAMILKRFGR
jgi:hypothetical protein